jgi:hypothetical protein
MGYRLICVTTPESGVTRGDANTPKSRCVTTTTPKGGGVVVVLRHLLPREVVQSFSLSTAKEVGQ